MRPLITGQTWGFCYLFHFSRPLGNLTNARAQAAHYVGFAADDGSGEGLESRIAEHLKGNGARITKAAIAAGITIELVAAWRAPLSFEKRLKARKEAPRLCPICCKARGRKVKLAMVVPEQLALPFGDDNEAADFPTPPAVRADWLEITTLRRWRAATPALSLADDWDEGLL